MQRVFREDYKKFLFNKHILVAAPSGCTSQYAAESRFAMAKYLNINIIRGGKMADMEMFHFASSMLGENVPKPFYQGFPDSVRKLSPSELYYDQILSYFRTYGMGDFSTIQHSVLESEEDIRRKAFKETGSIKDFEILTEEQAAAKLAGYIDDMLASTRPLSEKQLDVVRVYILDYDYMPKHIASKSTSVRLLIATKDPHFAEPLYLSDVIKVLEYQHRELTGNFNLRKLNLPNKTRKFLTSVIDQICAQGHIDTADCYEKKKVWSGLLHHIHYKPKNQAAKDFVQAMRGKENHSAYSSFERKLRQEGVLAAAEDLLATKGASALLRNLNYLASRTCSEEELQELLALVKTRNAILLMQLLAAYDRYGKNPKGRAFQFIKCNLLLAHGETEEEIRKRKSYLTPRQVQILSEKVNKDLRALLAGRLGKVCIDPSMSQYAVPLKESASSGGFGVLSSGSRIHIGEHEKLRAFTYWERVDDIDLSVIGIDEQGHEHEFSWRTMAHNQSDAITYSGDETSGFNGGSEYFDIDLPKFREKYPDIRYLVFCDNVYSWLSFDLCICRAGYMIRDRKDSGEVFEPKTVQSAFTINAPARFCFLFGLDLQRNDFVWLNSARSLDVAVAGETSMSFLIDTFHVTECLNLKVLFEMLATETVSDPALADVIVTDHAVEPYHEGQQILREYDFERIMALCQ